MKRDYPEFFVRPSVVMSRFPSPVFYFLDKRAPTGTCTCFEIVSD